VFLVGCKDRQIKRTFLSQKNIQNHHERKAQREADGGNIGVAALRGMEMMAPSGTFWMAIPSERASAPATDMPAPFAGFPAYPSS